MFGSYGQQLQLQSTIKCLLNMGKSHQPLTSRMVVEFERIITYMDNVGSILPMSIRGQGVRTLGVLSVLVKEQGVKKCRKEGFRSYGRILPT